MTYELDTLLANIRTHVPDFDMASEIMNRLHRLDLHEKSQKFMSKKNSIGNHKNPCFVLYRQPSEGKAEILYVGSDKGLALDALLSYTGYCELSEINFYEGNYEN